LILKWEFYHLWDPFEFFVGGTVAWKEGKWEGFVLVERKGRM
jgi:hypothetical protein